MAATETKVTRAPLPWHTAGTANPNTDPRQGVWGPTPPGAQSGEWIAKDIRPANAEFIVRACNAHDDLLDALRSFCGDHEATGFECAGLNAAYRHAKALLARIDWRG